MHLPIHDHKSEFLELIQNHQVVVVVGPTGSGKTTQIPQFLLEAGYGKDGVIGVTGPRRLPATEVAQHVACQHEVICGDEVGYQIRHDNKTSEKTKIKYMTEGILLKEMQNDPELSQYEVVMVDEVHEAGTNLQLILGLIKPLLSRRDDLKIVIASATIDYEKFSNYFEDAPVLIVEGSLYNVEVIYRPLGCEQYYTDKIISTIQEIIRSGKKGDILAFLTGEEDINATASLIAEIGLDVVACPLYAQLAPHLQTKALQQYNKRKVVLATNIAETSITIDGIVFVIDSGLIKQCDYDPNTYISTLEVVKHSRAGCIQRMGRAGRTREGICYRLYDEEDFISRPDFSVSEIKRSNLSSATLYMNGMGVENFEKYPLLERPDFTYIRAANKLLISLGALTLRNTLTTCGREMLKMPMEPHQARQVLAGIEYNCAEAVIIITSMVSVGKNPFVRPPKNNSVLKDEAKKAKKRFIVPESDHLTFYKLYTKWIEDGGSLLDDDWYLENWINRSVMESAFKNVEQMISILGSSYYAGTSNNVDIRKAILEGLLNKVCKRSNSKSFFTHIYSNETVSLYPGSVVLRDGAKFIVAEELITNGEGGLIKAYLNTVIKSDWLNDYSLVYQ